MSEPTTDSNVLASEPSNTPPTPSKGMSPSNIVAGIILLAIAGFGLYIGSFWWSHSSRISNLKSRRGDFVQLLRQEEGPEPGNRRQQGTDAEGDKKEEPKKAEKGVMDYVHSFIRDITPSPIQVVYWKDPNLDKAGVDLILQFADVETMSIKCDSIDNQTMLKILSMPKLKRLRVTSKDIEFKAIDSWETTKTLESLTLINTTWKSKDMDEVRTVGEKNKGLAGKLNVSNQDGPVFGASG